MVYVCPAVMPSTWFFESLLKLFFSPYFSLFILFQILFHYLNNTLFSLAYPQIPKSQWHPEFPSTVPTNIHKYQKANGTRSSQALSQPISIKPPHCCFLFVSMGNRLCYAKDTLVIQNYHLYCFVVHVKGKLIINNCWEVGLILVGILLGNSGCCWLCVSFDMPVIIMYFIYTIVNNKI